MERRAHTRAGFSAGLSDTMGDPGWLDLSEKKYTLWKESTFEQFMKN